MAVTGRGGGVYRVCSVPVRAELVEVRVLDAALWVASVGAWNTPFDKLRANGVGWPFDKPEWGWAGVLSLDVR